MIKMIEKIRQYTNSHTTGVRGCLWMLAACFWFAVMTCLVRHISTEVHPFEMVFFRNVFSLLFLLPWAFSQGYEKLKTPRFKLHVYRGITGVVGMWMWFYALSKVELNHAVALSFTVPLITTLLAILFLHEKVGWHRWLALFIGFSGTLVILRPGAETIEFASLLVIATTCVWSVSNVLVKKMTQNDEPKLIVFYMTLVMLPLSLPIALTVWEWPDWQSLLWLLLLGYASNQAQLYMSRAYALTDISVVLPIDFTRLIFVSVFSYVVFNEILDMATLIGALIIFLSSVYIVERESKIKRKESKNVGKARKAPW